MNSDLLIACIIAGIFFLFLCGIFVDGIVRGIWQDEKDRKFYTGKSNAENPWIFAEVIPENPMRKI